MVLPPWLAGLAHNRLALAGAAGAAGLGLYVAHRHKTSAPATAAATTTDQAASGGVGGVTSGFPDTSATDVNAALGAFASQLQTDEAAIAKLSGPGAAKPGGATGAKGDSGSKNTAHHKTKTKTKTHGHAPTKHHTSSAAPAPTRSSRRRHTPKKPKKPSKPKAPYMTIPSGPVLST